MNINFTLLCETCETETNVRFGMSNRSEQPVRFACQSCGAAIDIVMRTENTTITGATQLHDHREFEPDTFFVDLHIDFPVSFEPYERGMTPFMRAAERIGTQRMAIHQDRLNQLNAQICLIRDFRNILRLYSKEKTLPFKLNIQRVFDIEVASDRPEDINAALYVLIAKMMLPFEYPRQSSDIVKQCLSNFTKIDSSHKTEQNNFVWDLVNTGFLKNIQNDTLKIYPKMLEAEVALRPALFLDFDQNYAKNPIAMRVSTNEFEQFKDLYKDITEILSRQFVLVAGVNNLLKRGNHDVFAPILSKVGKNLEPENLNKFADISFGRKREFLDDCWYEFLVSPESNQLRNAIAHNKTDYDDITQIVSYYPKQEGMEKAKKEEIYFLEFMRQLLVSYREMHRLHHLAKSLLYYEHLILRKVS